MSQSQSPYPAFLCVDWTVLVSWHIAGLHIQDPCSSCGHVIGDYAGICRRDEHHLQFWSVKLPTTPPWLKAVCSGSSRDIQQELGSQVRFERLTQSSTAHFTLSKKYISTMFKTFYIFEGKGGFHILNPQNWIMCLPLSQWLTREGP
jgi:predicted amidophosphoribosyltransferase